MLTTAYPARRAWLYFVVRAGNGRVVFESGALNADGSIIGNDSDEDHLKFEPHYREITSSQEVEIYEPILKDSEGKLTTGLRHAAGYWKNNRLFPHGFNKPPANKNIPRTADQTTEPKFPETGSQVRYAVPT